MDLELDGAIAVVTGGSRGIGLAVTRALIAEGAFVVVGARERSAEIADLEAAGQVAAVTGDLLAAGAPEALVARAADLGGIDVLVNNAGAVSPRPGGFASITDADWDRTMALTLMVAVRTTRAALPQLMRRGGGSIVTVSSVNAFLPDPLVLDYSAGKAALTNFCKALSKEVGPQGIRVNTVSPGPVSTDLWLGEHGVASTVAAANDATPDDVAALAASGAVTGRFTRPDEVAALVAVLAGHRLANVTGADFVIDGGLVTTL